MLPEAQSLKKATNLLSTESLARHCCRGFCVASNRAMRSESQGRQVTRPKSHVLRVELGFKCRLTPIFLIVSNGRAFLHIC